jgi:hypothetical protein
MPHLLMGASNHADALEILSTFPQCGVLLNVVSYG